MSIKLVGSASGNVAEVDAANNMNVTLPQTRSRTGGATLLSEISLTADLAGRVVRNILASRALRATVGMDSPLFESSFEGTNIPQALVSQQVTTMAIAQAGGFLKLNSGASAATTVNARIQTYQMFPLYGSCPIFADCQALLINSNIANKTIELGFMQATGTAAPTDGVFFRWNTTGELRGVINYNGTENQTADLFSGNYAVNGPADNVTHLFRIVIGVTGAEFWIDGSLRATIALGTTTPMPMSASLQPFAARTYTAGSAPSGAPQIQLGYVSVSQGDLGNPLPANYALAGMGGTALQVQQGSASGINANYANSAAPASAALSNTAAGYTTLGGQWQFAAVASAETDFALFGFQVPAGSPTLPGKQLFITDIRLSTWNSGAINSAATATVLQWALGVGASAVSLATADGAAAKRPRVLTLGTQTFAISAAIGASPLPGDIVATFATPLVANPGEFVHVILKVPLGAATASQIIRGTCGIGGFFR